MSTNNNSTCSDPRQQRGLEIASKYKLRQKGDVWIVPSQSVEHQYRVDPAAGTCTCPDYEIRRARCKHIWAVEFQLCQEVKPDGTRTVTKTVRVTYAQNWPAYNAAQTTERDTFLTLLHGLCSGIDEPPQTFGRPEIGSSWTKPLVVMTYPQSLLAHTTTNSRCARMISSAEYRCGSGSVTVQYR